MVGHWFRLYCPSNRPVTANSQIGVLLLFLYYFDWINLWLFIYKFAELSTVLVFSAFGW